MQKNEANEQEDLASDDDPKSTNPDISFNPKTGDVAIDLDFGEWILLWTTFVVLTVTGVIVI